MIKGLHLTPDVLEKFNKHANDHHLRYGRMLEFAIDETDSKAPHEILRCLFDTIHSDHLDRLEGAYSRGFSNGMNEATERRKP